jgi:ubiquinone/menaquinone biosynthesis C-methylase UbiE
MKDNFSDNARSYAQFRPHYPDELFAQLLPLVKNKNAAWDCGTGNGQVAGVLADHFKNVYATDISRGQLEQAVQKPNIHYSVQPAEHTDFSDDSFDLVTIAQAIHWFRFHEFYTEVKRTLKSGGLIAVIGYGLLETDEPLQQLLHHFYRKIVGPYWDAERRYLDEDYKTIPFPFEEIDMPALSMKYCWTRDQLLGYLRTWSAVKHYQQRNGVDPVGLIEADLMACFRDVAEKEIVFPLLLRVGRNGK